MSREKKLVIAFDCDDVLVDSASTIVDEYNRAYGTTVTLESFYNLGDRWQADSEEDAIRRVDKLLKLGILDDLEPRDDVIDTIHELARFHELHLVTGRQDYMEPATAKLLDRYFPGCFSTVEHTNYIIASDTKAVRRSKGEVCSQIGANVFIDDHIFHAENVLAAGVSEVIVFGDYPWNRSVKLSSGIARCSMWLGDLGVREEIRRIASR